MKYPQELFKAILQLKTPNEARRFFRDLLTEAELLEFGNRWTAAQMLNAGLSYNDIQQSTGLSSRTIARIGRWLNGSQGGYRLVIKRLKK